MAQVANKPLHLDGTPGQGHGQGLGSGSGAGIWLAGTASTPEGIADKENRAAPPAAGRSYHISTSASRPASTANDLILTMNPSDSGDVDLDLSFDFVSQLETAKHQVETPTNNLADDAPEPGSPRGMSTAARWSSRLKKQPPCALKLPNKKQLAVTASHFSPISPLDHKAGGEAPLLVLPLGASRRAQDSGISSEQIENLSPAELVQMQRLAAQSQMKGSSPEKRSPVKQPAAGLIRKRTVLGENKNKSNAQIAPLVEMGDVFDDGSYDYTKHLITSESQISSWTGNKSTSYGTALNSTKKYRQVPDSMESINTYGSALTGASSEVEVPTIEVDSAADNGLGLDMAGGVAKSSQDTSAHLNDTADSSPDTPFSPMFSESDTTKSHSDGVNTPSTAFSTLFDERGDSSKSGDSAPMKRGLSAPLAGAATIGDTITEEGSSKRSSHIDQPLTQDRIEGLKELHGAVGSVSDFGSSPIKGDRPMIVSTASSPTNEVEFLFRKAEEEGKGGSAIPWPQGPLLLNFAETSATDDLSNGLGLGIDMGGKMGDHLQLDMSEISVERVILPSMDTNTLALDMGMEVMKDFPAAPATTEPLRLAAKSAKAQIPASPSVVSSVEGFAINMTPADAVEHAAGGASPASAEAEGQGRSRWSSKLWSLSPLTSLRSPSRARAGTSQGPTMKTLTLVTKSKGSDTLQVQDGYNSVPSSAVLPTFATFAPLQPPSQALASRARSSRHVSRSSRLQYIPNEGDHIQVDMSTPPVDRGSKSSQLEAVSQFKSADAALTPKMEYVNSARTRRHSWGYASTVGDAATASWPAPRFLNVSDGFGGLRNSTLSAVGSAAEAEPYRPMDTVVEDGIRRRANHRATNSVPSTPSVIPMSWASPQLHEPYPVYDEGVPGVQFDHSNEAYIRPQQGRRRTNLVESTIGIHGPSSTLGTYLLGLTGTRNRNTMTKTVGQHYSLRRESKVPIFSDDGEQIEGIIAFSGRALENASPSKSLFFAGFLGMPWLWFIGGWGLENDGSVYVNREGVWDHGFENRASSYSVEPTATHVSGLNPLFEKRASMLSAREEQNHQRYSMGTPESVINMEEEYQDFQRRGKARSFTGTATPLQGDDQMLGARRAHSLLEGDERNSMRPVSRRDLLDMARDMHSIDMQRDQQEGFAFSSQLERDSFSRQDHVTGIRGALAMPASAWDDYDEVQNAKGKKRTGKETFLQQVKVANVSFFNQLRGANESLMQRFTSSASTNSSFSLANVEQRRKAEERARVFTTPDHQPVLIRIFTDFSRLETFVLWNRLMAIVVSIAVFGAAGVALYFVVTDW